MKFRFLLLSLLVSFFTTAQTIDFQKIDELINTQIDADKPGLAVGVVQDGKIIYERYRGLANLEYQIPIDQQTKFNIASTAKQFTALCILKLVLENKLDLEDDIRKFIPDIYPNIEEKLPVNYVLSHTSGIRDFYDLLSLQYDPWWKKVGMENEDAMALLRKQNSLNFIPGTEYLYSNSNYTILTEIVSKVSGTDFAAYAKNLFKEMGMPNTHFSTNYMAVIDHLAAPYSDWGDGVWQRYPMLTDLHGDGFLYTTLKDQLRYEQLLQDEKLLPELNELFEVSQKPVKETKIQTYGFGLDLIDYKGYASVQHSGGTGSYNCQMLRIPEKNIAIFAMSNNSQIWSGNITFGIADLIIEEKNQKVKPKTAFSNTIKGQLLDAALLGNYQTPKGNIIRIFQEGDGFYWQNANNNPRRLLAKDNDVYVFEQFPEAKIVFQKEKDKNRFTFYYPDSEPKEYPKLPDFTPTPDYFASLNGSYFSEELNTGFSIEHTEKRSYTFKGEKVTASCELIAKDFILFYDYQMKIERNSSGAVSAILVTYSRVRDVRFEKKDD